MERHLEGTYIVAPAADPEHIAWRYEGAGKVAIDDAGN